MVDLLHDLERDYSYLPRADLLGGTVWSSFVAAAPAAYQWIKVLSVDLFLRTRGELIGLYANRQPDKSHKFPPPYAGS
jgi:hypothetical protein